MAKKTDRQNALTDLTRSKGAPVVAPVARRRGRPKGSTHPLGERMAYSFGLRVGEIAELDAIAAQHGLFSDKGHTKPNRNALGAYLLRWALTQYRAGKLKIPVQQTNVIPDP